MNYIKKISDLNLLEDESKLNIDGDSLMIEKGVQDYDWVSRLDACEEERAPNTEVAKVYIIAYIALAGVMQFLAKLLMVWYFISPFEILIVKSGVEVFLSLLYLWHYDLSLFDVEAAKANKVLANALLAFFSLAANFVALKALPLGMALAIIYLGYHFTEFFESLMFTFVLRSLQLLGYLVAFVGIAMIVHEKNDGDLNHIIAVLIGLIGSLLSGFHSVLLRQIVSTVEPLLCTIYTNLTIACFITILELTSYDSMQTTYTAFMTFLLLLVGILGWCSNFALSVIVHHEKSLIRPYMFGYSVVVLGSIVSIFNGELTALSLVGIALIGTQFVVAIC